MLSVWPSGNEEYLDKTGPREREVKKESDNENGFC